MGLTTFRLTGLTLELANTMLCNLRTLSSTFILASVVMGRLSAAPGDLDLTFSQDGEVTTDFFGHSDSGESIALQSDGKIVVAGSAMSGDDRSTSDFAVVRFNLDGTLDSSFGGDGKVTTDINGED